VVELSLEWIEEGCLKTQSITLNKVTKQSGVTRIGRDPSRCDIVLADGSISGLHVEIGYDHTLHSFYIQNLRESNPPIINHEPLLKGRRVLLPENILQLGNLQIRANQSGSTDPPPNLIPPTEIQSFGASPTPSASAPSASPLSSNSSSLPQYAPPDSPRYFQASSGNPSAPAFRSGQADNNASVGRNNSGLKQNNDVYSSVEADRTSRDAKKSPFLLLALGMILFGLFGLAWPNIRGFLGIGSSTIESDQLPNPGEDSAPRNDAFSISDRELFVHSSGLFEIEVPRNWIEIDNSRAGQLLIQAWHHPQVNAYIIMRIFAVAEPLSPDELALQSQQLVDDLFSGLKGYERSEPTIFDEGWIEIFWDGEQDGDKLVASTYVRQDGLNLSTLTLWAPANVAEGNVLEDDVNEILASWGVNPNEVIP
jgi:hypothetical protein